MKKILHIFPTFGLGGQQRRLVDIINGLGTLVHHDIISLSADCDAQALFSNESRVCVRSVAINKGGGFSLANMRLLRAIIERGEPDTLCTYNWGTIEAVFAWRWLRRNLAGQPVPGHFHFEDGFGPDETISRQSFRRVVTRRLALSKSLTIVPSMTLEQLARETWRLPADRVRRISNGIDLARFREEPRSGDRHGPVHIGSVGALRAEKRFDRLIDAVGRAAINHSLRLTIVGDGPEKATLEKKCSELYVSAFPGASNSPEDWYRQFDLFALSSDTEQMPISLIEAMASGLPVVATDVGDIKRMVAPQNRDFITPLGDDAAYAQAIERLAGDIDLRRQLGSANQVKALRDYDRAAMLAIYRDLWGLAG